MIEQNIDLHDYGYFDFLILNIVNYSDKPVKPSRLFNMALLANALIKGKVPTSYIANFHSEHIDDIEESTDNLIDDGYLVYIPKNGFKITVSSKELLKELNKKYFAEAKIIRNLIFIFNSLSDRQVKNVIQFLFSGNKKTNGGVGDERHETH